MLKLNKMQVRAICEKVKRESQLIIKAEEKRLGDLFVFSADDLKRIADMEDMVERVKTYNENYKDLPKSNSLYWSGYTTTVEGLKKSIKKVWVENNLPKFDFTSLEQDVILKTLEVDNAADLISVLLDSCKK